MKQFRIDVKSKYLFQVVQQMLLDYNYSFSDYRTSPRPFIDGLTYVIITEGQKNATETTSDTAPGTTLTIQKLEEFLIKNIKPTTVPVKLYNGANITLSVDVNTTNLETVKWNDLQLGSILTALTNLQYLPNTSFINIAAIYFAFPDIAILKKAGQSLLSDTPSPVAGVENTGVRVKAKKTKISGSYWVS